MLCLGFCLYFLLVIDLPVQSIAWKDLLRPDPQRGAASGLRWGTSVLQTRHCPPLEKNPSGAHVLTIIGVARILSRVHFFPQKSCQLFLVVTPKRRYIKPLNEPDFCSAWAVHFVCWGALTNFPCKLRREIFFLRSGGEGAPTVPPATSMLTI